MEQNIIVLGLKKYKFKDERTQQIVEGTTVHYIVLGETDSGYIPLKATLPKDFTIPSPCVATGIYSPVNVGGKLNLKLTSIEYQNSIEFNVA